MIDHSGRRRILYDAVTLLEPYACSGIVQHYVAWKHKLFLPTLRIYVDLERLTREKQLVRHIRQRLGGPGTTFFWETPGLVLVEPVRTPLKRLSAAAPLETDAITWPGDGHGNFVHLLPHLAGASGHASAARIPRI